MNVSKRIKTIVEAIEHKTVADIGTDHGYISIYAAKSKEVDKIIACDVNKEPLASCISNIKEYKMESNIEARLANGIDKLKENEVETIIIAGMGGNLIVDILKANMIVTKSAKQLILQPQSNMKLVRKFIHEIGFSIKEEKLVYEEEQLYFIINCMDSYEKGYMEQEYRFGKIPLNEKNQLLIKYIEPQIEKEKYIKKNILENAKALDLVKLDIINENIEYLKKALDKIKEV